MAELADAHGSGPCESNFMQVQVLLPAPKTARFYRAVLLYIYKKLAIITEISPFFLGRRTTCALRALAIPHKILLETLYGMTVFWLPNVVRLPIHFFMI